MKVYKLINALDCSNDRAIDIWHCDTNDPMIAIKQVQKSIANNCIINYYPVLRWKAGVVLALVERYYGNN